MPLADSWKMWDNEGDAFKRLAESNSVSHDELVTLLTSMSLKEDHPRKMSPSTERALRAGQLAYEDAKAENTRWGLPMVPQEWDPRIEPVYTGKSRELEHKYHLRGIASRVGAFLLPLRSVVYHYD